MILRAKGRRAYRFLAPETGNQTNFPLSRLQRGQHFRWFARDVITDRRASLERRRRQAMGGVVPAKIAASFRMAELAVLTVVCPPMWGHHTICLKSHAKPTIE